MGIVKEKIKGLLTNHPVRDVRFEYNTMIIVLNGGHEIEISSEEDYDSHLLSVEHYVIERKQLDRVELD